MKVGIVREGKIKTDYRVPLTPKQCRYLLDKDRDLQIFVQPSPERCFTDRGISKPRNCANRKS